MISSEKNKGIEYPEVSVKLKSWALVIIIKWTGFSGKVYMRSLCLAFERQTSFMEMKNLKSYVGAYVITVRVDDDGNLLTVIPEYVDFD